MLVDLFVRRAHETIVLCVRIFLTLWRGTHLALSPCFKQLILNDYFISR